MKSSVDSRSASVSSIQRYSSVKNMNESLPRPESCIFGNQIELERIKHKDFPTDLLKKAPQRLEKPKNLLGRERLSAASCSSKVIKNIN